MPWIEAISDQRELRRCIRDLVALSTLPAIWRTYDSHRIADSVAAALVSMLDLEFIYISLPGGREEPAIEITRTGAAVDPGSDGAFRRALLDQLPLRPSHAMAMPHPLNAGMLRLAFAPIGFGTDALLVAGSRAATFPTEIQRLLLGTAANDATVALQRWHTELEQRRFLTLVESSSEFIAVANLDGMVQYVNAAGLQLVGLIAIEEASRPNLLNFLMPEDAARARAELWPRVMRDGRWVGELSFCHFVTGAAIPMLVDWFRIDNVRSGRPMNIATVSRDLTGRKKAEAELRRLNDTLEQRVAKRTAELAETNRKLVVEITERERSDARLRELQLELFHAARLSAAGQLAAALAHELNQPLTAAANSIKAAKRLLRKNSMQSGATAGEVLDEAFEQSIRAGQIIRRLRDFVSRGDAETRAEYIADMVTEAVQLALIGADSLGVEVDVRLDPNVSQAFADRIQIQQVLTNLIRNAVEAMAENGGRQIVIGASPLDASVVEITVADRGPGLSDEVRSRLFEPFVSTKHNGMGLGLSICRSIVETHGGNLRCDPNPGGGAIFRFTLAAVPRDMDHNAL
jgi:PAS domain S-box-containing protein